MQKIREIGYEGNCGQFYPAFIHGQQQLPEKRCVELFGEDRISRDELKRFNHPITFKMSEEQFPKEIKKILDIAEEQGTMGIELDDWAEDKIKKLRKNEEIFAIVQKYYFGWMLRDVLGKDEAQKKFSATEVYELCENVLFARIYNVMPVRFSFVRQVNVVGGMKAITTFSFDFQELGIIKIQYADKSSHFATKTIHYKEKQKNLEQLLIEAEKLSNVDFISRFSRDVLKYDEYSYGFALESYYLMEELDIPTYLLFEYFMTICIYMALNIIFEHLEPK